MWYSPKTLLAAGALLALAGSRCPAQVPADGGQKPLPLPMPSEAADGPVIHIIPYNSNSSSGAMPQVDGPPAAPVRASAAPKSLLGSGSSALLGGSCPPLLAYRTEYQYPPFGTMMNTAFQTEVNNGNAARMMLYEYDFICGGAELNLRGSDRLVQLATMCKAHGYPLVVERTPYDVRLAEARRLAVLNCLTQMGFAVPPERVVIGVPLAIPLRGVEAEVIYRNLLKQTDRGGYQQSQSQGQTTSTGDVIGGALNPK